MSEAEVHELSCSCAKLPFVLLIGTGIAINVANSFMYLWHSIQNKRSTVFFSYHVKIISNELSGLHFHSSILRFLSHGISGVRFTF